MNLHPQFIGKEGLDEYVVLPIEEFRAVRRVLLAGFEVYGGTPVNS